MKLFSKETYQERRNKLKKSFSGGLLLFLGNEESSSNFKDNWYPFRQDSSFLYFFGLNLPGLVAVVDLDLDVEIIFGDELTTEELIWHGEKPKLRDLAVQVGISQTRPMKDIGNYLKNGKQREIHFLPPYRPENTQKLIHWLNISGPRIPAEASEELIKAVVALRSIKSDEEIAEISRAVNTSVNMHRKVMMQAKPGMKEYELLGMVTAEAVAAGGNPSFLPIITVDGQILHNHNYSNTLTEGKMLLGDFGAESDMHYAGDITRTIPVGKKFSVVQKEVYDLVYFAHVSAIQALKPGVRFLDIHLLACKKLAEGLRDMGLMKGDIDDAVHQGAHALFFQCGLGHMMGLDVHDMEDLGEEYVGYTPSLKKSDQFGLKSLRLGKELEQGHVLTVEPGLYFIPQLMDQWEANNVHKDYINYGKLANFRNFGGIRIEDDFLITRDGSSLLGDPLESSTQELESLRNR
ncbi:aminopeptidase P family protein [Cyclobacterium plantarum]|uniref:Xaa-Pro aminopeptidase n=1 Tax=Cyclobacterium plantarum TaxID=2716263 RepID=A0ABX0H8F9_9BACT|nr:aminopeptidase P family protein [Cyclobacterium plantarum]NHE58169.1 aminopeptidase P family protein [Cyclobacterium plantarum]